MVSVEIETPSLFARDIAAYSDAELDRYLEVNGRYVKVQDPENLPDEFIQRLRDRTHAVRKPIESRPVDPNQLAAALEQHTGRKRSPSISTTASEHSSDVERDYQSDVQRQTKSYHALVEAGGRPSHPLSRLEDIVEDPEYRELLFFWHDELDEAREWRVFKKQLDRWRDFQRLQRYARGESDHDHWRNDWEYSDTSLGHELDENDWEFQWQHHKRRFGDRRMVTVSGQYWEWEEFVYCKGRPIKGQGFPEYVEALKDRLTRYGFTRTFQLDEDLARQDKLTTWIEYLGYEYWWHDQYAGYVEQEQEHYENAWKDLVNSNVLRPGETRDFFLRRDGAIDQLVREEERAEKSVDSAISAVSSAQRTLSRSARSKRPLAELQKQLSDAQSALDAAKGKHQPIKKRNELINKFYGQIRDYSIMKKEGDRHSVLLHWVRQQIPLIELDLNPPNLARGTSERMVGRKKRKRVEECDHEPDAQEKGQRRNDKHSTQRRKLSSTLTADGGNKPTAGMKDRSTKRQKNNDPTPKLPDLLPPIISASNPTDIMAISKSEPSENTAMPTKPKRNGSKVPTHPSSRTFPPLRRSKRIAMRLNNIASPLSDSLNHSIQLTTMTHMPAPPSITERSLSGVLSRTRVRNSSKKSGITKPQRTPKRRSRNHA